jgi:hypothetical protein
MGTAVDNIFVADSSIVRKWLMAPQESRMAHHLMVLVSISIVLRRIEAARA